MISFTTDELQDIIKKLKNIVAFCGDVGGFQMQSIDEALVPVVNALIDKIPEKEERETLQKNKDVDIENVTPRNVVCIRSDRDVWKVGGDKDHVLEIGKEYHIDGFEIHTDYTLLQIRDTKELKKLGWFNSVLFREL